MTFLATFKSALRKLLVDDEYVLQVGVLSIRSTDLNGLRELIPLPAPPYPVMRFFDGSPPVMSKPVEWSMWLLRASDEPKFIGGSKIGMPHAYRGTTE